MTECFGTGATARRATRHRVPRMPSHEDSAQEQGSSAGFRPRRAAGSPTPASLSSRLPRAAARLAAFAVLAAPLALPIHAAAQTVETTVSIASNYDRIGAGLEPLEFTLTRGGATTNALAATVTIAQDQEWLETSDLSHTVNFAAGNAEAKLTLSASSFSFTPSTTGNLTATVGGAGIAANSKTVAIVSTPEAPITIGLDQPEYVTSEGVDETYFYVVVTLHEAYPRAPSRIAWASFTTIRNTAVEPEDYDALSSEMSFEKNDYQHNGTAFAARVRLAFRDDAPAFIVHDDNVYEGTEDFSLRIEHDPNAVPGMIRYAKPDGTPCLGTFCNPTHKVTITDEDDIPEFSLSAAPTTIGEQRGDVRKKASVVTVEITNGKAFATFRDITLSLSGTATELDDYRIESKSLNLLGEWTRARTTITAVVDNVDEPDETILIDAAISIDEGDAPTAVGTQVTVTIDDDSPNNLATGKPGVSGTAMTKETLTATIGNLDDADDLPATFPDDYGFGWVRVDGLGNPTSIQGATSHTYTPGAADVGSTLKVEVTFTDGAGFLERVASDAVGPVTASPETVTPELSLSAAPASITEEDYDSTPDVVENVSVVTVEITNRTAFATDQDITLSLSGTATELDDYSIASKSLTLVAGTSSVSTTITAVPDAVDEPDETIRIRAAIGATAVGTRVTVTIDDDPPNNPATGKPAVRGTPRMEQPLEATLGTIMDADGLPDTFPDDYRLQWVRVDRSGNETQVGTDSATYTPGPSDVFSTLKVEVSFTDDAGYEEMLASDAVGSVPAGPSVCNATPNLSSSSTTELWRGTISVGDLGRSTLHGYSSLRSLGKGTPYGALSDTTFSFDGTNYTIWQIDRGDRGIKSMQVHLDKKPPRSMWEQLNFHVCGLTFGMSARSDGQLSWSLEEPLWGGSRWRPPWDVMPDGLVWPVGDSVEVAFSVGPRAVQARFEEVPPEHDGENAFTVRLALVTETENGVLRDALEVTGGTVTRVRRDVGGPYPIVRTVTVEPGGAGAVDIVLPPGPACGVHGAICTEDGGRLAGPVVARIPGPANGAGQREGPSPLTARFENVPAEHDGEGAFTVEVVFSEAPHGTSGNPPAMNNRVLRDALEVTGGAVAKVRRMNRDPTHRIVTVEPDGAGAVDIVLPPGPACGEEGAICTEAGGRLESSVVARIPGPANGAGQPAGPSPLTARFENVPPEHDGEGAFTFEVAFSEDIGTGSATLRDDSFDVDEATVTAARRVDGRNDLWELTVRPDSRADVNITLPGNRTCTTTGAVCTREDQPRPLTNSPSATVAGPPDVPLTASFANVPAEHDGGEFTFDLSFSEDLRLSYKKLRDHAFSVTAGDVRRAQRKTKGSNQDWTITVEPAGAGDVAITLPETTRCGARGAICTSDGRKLSHATSANVRGPVGIIVSDTRVVEGDEPLVFAVALSRAAGATITVDYATSDGSALAGADYTATSGTLTIGAGSSGGSIEVAVLDDSHDEVEETMTLTLSNASGGMLTGPSATGTIENHDAMPRALVARFGRTAAVHVIEQVEERMAAPRAAGIDGRIGGHAIDRNLGGGLAMQFVRRLAGAAGHGRGAGTTRGTGGPGAGMDPRGIRSPGPGGHGALPGGAHNAMGDPMARGGGVTGPGAMGLGATDLLTGARVAVNREAGRHGTVSLWSRGAASTFRGREGPLSLGGEVRTTLAGADYAQGRLMTGVAVGRTHGAGTYRGADNGRVTTAVTGLYPWIGWRASERTTVWTVAGQGRGGLLLEPERGPAMETGLAMTMAAAGGRMRIAETAIGVALALKGDALWVGTTTEERTGAAGRLNGTEATVRRLRGALEASTKATLLLERITLAPDVEIGFRQDGGDAENGSGIDIAAGLVLTDAGTGLVVAVRTRRLVVHQAEGFAENGVSVAVSYDPRPESPLGLQAQVAPAWGGQASSGAEALWANATMTGMTHDPLGAGRGRRLESEVGYGLPLGSRYVGTPRVGVRTSEHGRSYRFGYGLQPLEQERVRLSLGIEFERRENPAFGLREGAAGAPDQRLLGQATIEW